MKVAVYGKQLFEDDFSSVQLLFDLLNKEGIEIYIHQNISNYKDLGQTSGVFSHYKEIQKNKFDFFITLGGDGTILRALTYVRDSNIPILGVNMGRLGFLASIEKRKIQEAIGSLIKGDYKIEPRELLFLESNFPLFEDVPIALNDITISRRDTSSMIVIHTFIDGHYLNSYWGDGLIISTPTGSTGYSLSCGGPIVFPGSGNFIITPIAPHNLNVRPLVISDSSEIILKVEGRTENFLCTLDSRFETISSSYELKIKKNTYPIQLVRMEKDNFMETIRNKLAWGTDKRNS
jgi:NAD+ kinase